MSDYAWQRQLFLTTLRHEDYKTAQVLNAIFAWNAVDPERPTVRPPAVGKYCDISADGDVLTHAVDVSGGWHIVNLGNVTKWRDGLRRLADAAQLSDADRITFFEEARKWVRNDWRPASVHNDLA